MANNIIPHSCPTLGPEEAEAAARVIRSGYIAQGKEVARFERRFAEYLGVSYAVAVNSGTSALHLTLLAMGIGPGDEVVIPSYVCTALLNAVNYTGAQPVLADVRRDTGNIDPEDVARRIGKRTRAAIVPHLFGLAAEMKPLIDIGVPVIEDCAQAVGASYGGMLAGTMGAASIFSFYATKVMTTGEGGMVATDRREIFEAVRDLRDYDKQNTYKIRYNYKMTDMQAAIGLVQLERLPRLINLRSRIAALYFDRLDGLEVGLPPGNPGHIYYRFVIDLKAMDLDDIRERLKAAGIECGRPVFIPLHRCLGLEAYPNAENVWQRLLSIPIYPKLLKKEAERIAEAVIEQTNT